MCIMHVQGEIPREAWDGWIDGGAARGGQLLSAVGWEGRRPSPGHASIGELLLRRPSGEGSPLQFTQPPRRYTPPMTGCCC
jgi:hypothetical protein